MATAAEIVTQYFQAWTAHDMDAAMQLIADDLVCDAPAGRIEGAAAYRAFLGPFSDMLIEARLLVAFGDDRTAVIMYDTRTPLVASAPGAEYVEVEDGRIARSTFIFDRLPFEKARAAAQARAAQTA